MFNCHISTWLVLSTLLVTPVSAAAQANDDWSPKVALRDDVTGDFLAPIHASLLPDGSVMLIGFSQTLEEPPNVSFRTGSFTALLVPPALGSSVPSEMYVTSYPEDVEYNLGGGGGAYLQDTYFCSGHATMADGTLFVAGGLRSAFDWMDPALGTSITGGGGIPYASTWDNVTKTWSRIPNDMVGQGSAGPVGTFFEGPDRYYPTVTRLADGRMLVIGGSQVLELQIVGGAYISNEKNLSAEVYDPQTGNWTELATYTASPPAIFNRDYTHAFVLPTPQGNFDALILGEFGLPVLMSTTAAPRWSALGSKRPGPDINNESVAPLSGAASALLPVRLQNNEWGYGNGSVLVAGGDGDYRDQADVYDPSTGNWGTRLALAVDRHHVSSVLLPNGEVLVVCGHDSTASDTLLRTAEYIDPAAGFAHRTGNDLSYAVRGYHTISLLLPDGRVLVGGGRLGGVGTTPEKANFELLSPPYIFNPRPTIIWAPSEIYYGQPFQVNWTGSADEAVLVAFGSMTHSIDMGQRHVQVELSPTKSAHLPPKGSTVLDASVEAPADSSIAPPGYYMLFLLAPDAERTPSVAKIVHLKQGTNPTSVPATLPAPVLDVRAFPNPFNPVTKIRYVVPSPGRVTIRVFDAGGRLIETLVDEKRHDAGVRTIDYRARRSSGVYFVRVDANGESVTRKIVLLK